MTIREATIEDLPQIRALLSEHAVFEGAPDPDAIRHVPLDSVLFGVSAAAHVAIAEAPDQPDQPDQPGVVAGLALWFSTFSSWEGTTGIWLEDLYLRPQFRRHGLGHQLMQHLRERTEGRIEWDVARENGAARSFYERLGAQSVPGFIRMRWILKSADGETG